ncbi:hypothetical protein QTP86_002894 [Hemibagrus guttatus]|nr:hypothetical protein QTP86_002894 [Hemibagrus guttatus]
MMGLRVAQYYIFVIMLTKGVSSDEIRLDQSPAVVKKPGETVKISCKIHGFDMTEYYMHWIRQKPGKALEWIGYVNSGGVSGVELTQTSSVLVKPGESFSISYVHGEELTQPASMTVQPGQSLSIHCKVSYSVTSYSTGWIRQPAGKALEWISLMDYDDSYGQSLTSSASVVKRPGESVTLSCTVSGFSMGSYYMHWIRQKPGEGLEWIRHIDDGVSSDEIRLDQSPAVVKKPGETVKISCKIHGFDMTSSYIHWIRQKPGKALEWLGRMNAGSNQAIYAESVKNQLTFTEDVSASTQYLEAKSLRTEDTAVYYCAREDTEMPHVFQKPKLVQPAVMLVKPGESFSVPCKIIGYSATSSCTDWIRHLSGQALEWIGWYCSSSDTGSRDSLKNKISFSAESSSNTVTLHGQNFQTEDTAVYYCARNSQ